MTTSATTAPTVALSLKNKVGLVLAGLLALGDLTSPFTNGGDGSDSDTAGPPMAVLVADCVLGLLTLVAVVHMWRTASRISARIIAGTRVLSVISALPAFFVSGVPAPVVVLVAAVVVVTVVTIVLVMSRPAATPA
jgi:hypothetical protein